MTTIVYVARARGGAEQNYTATFPDLPDLSVTAVALPDLLRDARAQLSQALKRLEAAGEAWPTPSTLEALSAEPVTGDLLLLIDVQVEDAPVRVNISIGERLLRRLDEAAEAHDMSRSGFIAAAVRRRLGEDGADRSQRLHEEAASLGRRIQDAVGAGSPLGRAITDLDSKALDGLRTLSALIGAKARPSGDT